jgi:hypothetical protein
MTFRVIEGGRHLLPEHRQGPMSPAERARCDVINRVCAGIFAVHAEDMPGYPTWQDFVDGAYQNAETNPVMLERVSDIVAEARAAIAALMIGDGNKPGDLFLATCGSHISGLAPLAVAETFDAMLNELLE